MKTCNNSTFSLYPLVVYPSEASLNGALNGYTPYPPRYVWEVIDFVKSSLRVLTD